jgi:serine protease Do
MGVAAVPAFAQGPPRPAGVVTIQRGGSTYLGIGVLDVTPDRAKALNMKEDRGAEVARVDEDSPAAKAGIKEGDVVLEYNGTPVEGIEQFVRLVHETPPGRQVKLAIWRNGSAQNITVTVGERKNTVLETPQGTWTLPAIPPVPGVPPAPPIEIPRFQMTFQNGMLGIEGESLGMQSQFADFLGVKDGVLVKSVVKNSPAEKAGIRAGDVITKVDGGKIDNTREITSQLRAARSRNNVPVTVVRDKKEMTLTVNLETNRNPTASEPQRGERF